MVVGESEDPGPERGLACRVICVRPWYAGVDVGEIIRSVGLMERFTSGHGGVGVNVRCRRRISKMGLGGS
jgi:hypothetical protein